MVLLVASMKASKGIRAAVKPKTELSEQTFSILSRFVRSGSDKMVFNFGGSNAIFMLGNNTTVGYSDARFLQDDLDKLVELKLLSRTDDGRFQRFGLTHAAVKFVAALDSPPTQAPQK